MPTAARPTITQIHVLSLTAMRFPRELSGLFDAFRVVSVLTERRRLLRLGCRSGPIAVLDREPRELDPRTPGDPGLRVGGGGGAQVHDRILPAEREPGGAALVAPQRLFPG